MKNLTTLLFSFILAICAASTQAQSGVYVNPQTMNTWNNPVSSYLDTVITNQNNANFFNNQMFAQMAFNKMVLNNLKIKYGNERISKGQASARFTPLAKNSFIEQTAQRIQNPLEQRQFIEANRQMLETFQSAMIQNGLTPYNLADARSLVYVIAFQILNDEFPGPQRLRKLAKDSNKQMLADAYSQGTPDSEKQYEYEQIGIQAILATYSQRLAARPGLTASEKTQAENTAKINAENLLSKVSNIPPGAIEMTADGFGNKADRLVKAGTGSTKFNRNSELVTPARNTEEESFNRSLVDTFDAEVKKRGGQTNDLAFANAVAFDLAFLASREGATLNSAQFNWILNEMISDMTTGQQALYFQGLTETQKQSSYESLAIRSVKLMKEFFAIAESRKKKQTDYFDAIAQATENSSKLRNLQFDTWKLMRDVFQPRKIDDYELTETGYRKIR
ncbi:MAG: hypothetical protein R2681_11705 [Pyrinomonadaceae bacterium]